MPNQNKPTPPLDEIAPHILRLWKACQNDWQIVQELQKHIDTTRYGIGLTTLLKFWKTMDAGAHEMWHNEGLHGTLQHCWMQTKKNVMPEIAWSQLRQQFTPGFKNLLDHGVNSGWMVFHWVFIPWLQQELDAYQDRVNNTAKQHDCNKILPHGVPNLIYHSAEDFGALDFKIKIKPEALDLITTKTYLLVRSPMVPIRVAWAEDLALMFFHTMMSRISQQGSTKAWLVLTTPVWWFGSSQIAKVMMKW
ncbi:hypothetical protein BDR03DRAFT_983291 [Suillus americanus]|nr:hypothetical protein BDR03DRAFT_983291 [Suillus americanus]